MFPNILLFRITWKQKSDYEIKDQIVQRDVNTYFTFALIATISTVSINRFWSNSSIFIDMHFFYVR